MDNELPRLSRLPTKNKFEAGLNRAEIAAGVAMVIAFLALGKEMISEMFGYGDADPTQAVATETWVPTNTSTLQPTSTPSPENVVTPSSTPAPSSTPTPKVEVAGRGEFSDNSIVGDDNDLGSISKGWVSRSENLAIALENVEKKFDASGNAFLTSLMNRFDDVRRDNVIADPNEEYGLGHNASDISEYAVSSDIAENFSNMLPSEIFTLQDGSSDLYTAGVMSMGHDRDFSATVMAMGVAYHEDSSMFTTPSGMEYSLEAVLDIMHRNPNGNLAKTVMSIRQEILDQIQERELGVSEQEKVSRSFGDASSLLGEFAGSDQWQSCDVELVPDNAVRSSKKQITRLVEHVNDGKNTRTSAHSSEEVILLAGTIRILGGDSYMWDIDGFTGRAVDKDGSDTVLLGDEMLPCGPGQVFVPSATPRRTPSGNNSPTPTTGNTATPTSENTPPATPTPTATVENTPPATPTPTATVEDTPTPVPTNTDTGEDLTLTPAITPQPTATDIP